MNRSLTVIGLSATLGLTACSGSGTSPQKPTTQNLNANVLQVAVGTANLYGDLAGGGSTSYFGSGLNVATTYRQSKTHLSPGDSAVAVSAPTLSGPFTLNIPVGTGGAGTAYSTIATGPAPVEIGGSSITATGQTSTIVTTFGTAGGVSGLGIEPFNFNSENGTPYSYVPYTVPAYDPTTDTNFFSPEGYPPAFPSLAGTGSPAAAYSEGIDVFAQVTPVAGPYTLSVSVPIANSPTFTTSKTATLTSTALLPPWAPQTPSLDSNDDGGASFAVTLPAGVTEGYIQLVDVGPGASSVSCNGSSASAPTFYTIFVNASGTATLAGNLGTGGTPSICTVDLNTAANAGVATPGDVFTVQYVGFDYPWYEASYPNSNGNPAPAITGANGQADVTISSATGYQEVAESGIKTIKSFRAKNLHAKALKYKLHR